ncbi:M14 family metallopeptidase [Rhodovibrionaceae bacterium A322]
MKISSNFDSGNITCLACSDPGDIQLEINRDASSDFFQWFHFRLSGAQGQDCALKIVNAGEAAYVKGWEGYQAVASYDRETWFRVPTDYDGKTLTIRHCPDANSVYYAYFAPYSMERHADLIAWAQGSALVTPVVLGETLDGQDLDLLEISAGGAAGDKKTLWVMARQHPGESMAEWWMEGFLGRLLDPDDPLARLLLSKANFYVVPNMNPDGSRRGHLRTNAAGANLNREWQDPSMEKSPEVFLALNKMRELGLDFCLDVHGDEALPYNFIAGTEGIEGWSDRLEDLLSSFKSALERANPDFQCVHGYPRNAPGKANPTIASNAIGQTFDCLSMTLEMPFKDTIDTPDEIQGWSPERCRKLGESGLDAIAEVIDKLR